MIEAILEWLIGTPWEYGTAIFSKPARRHRRTGEVQIKDAVGWCDVHSTWWGTFKVDRSGSCGSYRQDE